MSASGRWPGGVVSQRFTSRIVLGHVEARNVRLPLHQDEGPSKGCDDRLNPHYSTRRRHGSLGQITPIDGELPFTAEALSAPLHRVRLVARRSIDRM